MTSADLHRIQRQRHLLIAIDSTRSSHTYLFILLSMEPDSPFERDVMMDDGFLGMDLASSWDSVTRPVLPFPILFFSNFLSSQFDQMEEDVDSQLPNAPFFFNPPLDFSPSSPSTPMPLKMDSSLQFSTYVAVPSLSSPFSPLCHTHLSLAPLILMHHSYLVSLPLSPNRNNSVPRPAKGVRRNFLSLCKTFMYFPSSQRLAPSLTLQTELGTCRTTQLQFIRMREKGVAIDVGQIQQLIDTHHMMVQRLGNSILPLSHLVFIDRGS